MPKLKRKTPLQRLNAKKFQQKKRRQNEKSKRQEQERNTIAHQNARQDPTTRTRERERDKASHQIARQGATRRIRKQQRDAILRQVAWQDPITRALERELDAVSHQTDPSMAMTPVVTYAVDMMNWVRNLKSTVKPPVLIELTDPDLVPAPKKKHRTPLATKLSTQPAKRRTNTLNLDLDVLSGESVENPKTFIIPGYEIIYHILNPSNLRRGFAGSFAGQVHANLTTFSQEQIYTPDSGRMVILRIILTKDGKYYEETGKKMRVVKIKINGRALPLPNCKSNHFNFDLTQLLKGKLTTTPLEVEMSVNVEKWTTEYAIVASISVVKKLNVEEMVNDIKSRSWIPFGRTKEMVTQCLMESAEDGILTSDSSIPLPLKCPLGKNKIEAPCKGEKCDHFACFDASNFLRTYQNASYWKCPICDLPLQYEDLKIDSYFEVVLGTIGEDADNFQVKVDSAGNYSVKSTYEQNPGSSTQMVALIEVEDIVKTPSDDDNIAESDVQLFY